MDPLVLWLPQDFPEWFYYLKGGTALTASLLLLIHMRKVKAQEALTLGRWLRYLVLLYLSVLMTGAAAEQIAGTHSGLVQLGSYLGSVLLVVATVVSIHESRPQS